MYKRRISHYIQQTNQVKERHEAQNCVSVNVPRGVSLHLLFIIKDSYHIG